MERICNTLHFCVRVIINNHVPTRQCARANTVLIAVYILDIALLQFMEFRDLTGILDSLDIVFSKFDFNWFFSHIRTGHYFSETFFNAAEIPYSFKVA